MAETEKKLTRKEQRFVDIYLSNGFNGRKAAIGAGYSERSATEIASQNLRKVHIRDYIDARMAELAMPADEVLARLTEHARGDMGDFLAVAYEDLATHPQARLIKKIERTIKTVRNRKTDEETEIQHFKLELYDAQAALVQLGRYHKLFTDTVAQTGSIDVNVIDAKLRLAALLARQADEGSAGGDTQSTD